MLLAVFLRSTYHFINISYMDDTRDNDIPSPVVVMFTYGSYSNNYKTMKTVPIHYILLLPVVVMFTLALPWLPTLSVTVQVCLPESTALRYWVPTVATLDCPRTKHPPEQVEVHSCTTAPMGGVEVLPT